ncbi:MAG: hypothetical protein J0I11_08015 [Actinobacteria bacterium]|nr:hypothetical protein [Actinomycetota bacterium]
MTTGRARVRVAGARRDSAECIAGEPDEHALAQPLGRWSTKTYAVVDQHHGVLSFIVATGQRVDASEMITVPDGIRVTRSRPGRSERVLTDNACSSRANRSWLRAHHVRAIIPVPAGPTCDRQRRGARGG